MYVHLIIEEREQEEQEEQEEQKGEEGEEASAPSAKKFSCEKFLRLYTDTKKSSLSVVVLGAAR